MSLCFAPQGYREILPFHRPSNMRIKTLCGRELVSMQARTMLLNSIPKTNNANADISLHYGFRTMTDCRAQLLCVLVWCTMIPVGMGTHPVSMRHLLISWRAPSPKKSQPTHHAAPWLTWAPPQITILIDNALERGTSHYLVNALLEKTIILE